MDNNKEEIENFEENNQENVVDTAKEDGKAMRLYP